jgi:hypothetical protein
MSRTENNNLFKDKIENRLQRIANVLLLNASFIDNPGLLNGKMGIAIFFYHYSRYTKNKIYEDYAGELVDEIYEEISTSTSVNFENGLTGIGWGIEYLVKNKFVQADTDEALVEIDTSVYRNSLYRPFLLESGNDIFGYGLYFLARLREYGNDNENLNTLFKKQHLIYLTDDCERILIQKKNLEFKIELLSIETINSFAWFLIEMHRWGIFPLKVEKLFHSLLQYFESHLQNTDDTAGTAQLIKLIESVVPCIRDVQIQDSYKEVLSKRDSNNKDKEASDIELVNTFIKENWQNLIYDPYIPGSEKGLKALNQVFQIIDNEENWNIRLDNLNKNNLGLTGLTGIGLGLLRSEVLTDDGRSVLEGSGLRAQSTGQNSAVTTENISE